MFRQVYLEDWFADARYGTLLFVYAAGNPSAWWGGITKTHRVVVRIRPDGTLSSVVVVPIGTDLATIRSWYTTRALSLSESKAGAFWADRIITQLFGVTLRSSSGALISVRDA